MTLLSDGERLTGAYALGPEAASGCSRRRWPSARTSDRGAQRRHPALPELLRDLRRGLTTLRMKIMDMPQPIRPMAAQARGMSG